MAGFDAYAAAARVALVSLAAVLLGSVAGAVGAAATAGVPGALSYGVQSALASAVIGAVAVAAVHVRGGDWAFFDLDRPSARTVGIGLAAGVAMLGLLWAFSVLTTALNVPSASHGVQERIEANPTIALVMAVVSVLFVAPGEELLARGFVQKTLYSHYSPRLAVVVASAVFAGVHVFAYATAPALAVAASLTQLFCISLVLGAIYLHTENLVAPILAHTVYNAVQFLLVYLSV
ncbi:CPBP family intramembrane glutamic endopeptidase [Salarchaeum sp. JOR-1]|uniref:CPBP family intramembrane glutamic endopeptidase n=1 Tax=Salarchaeum sp. JOR-1 TaxID=2599399 RepID=UPI0011989831|nr:CPBP family intramembrane glutamic endopeptidase [Salarchaeum sp. JOR-1]QDX40504.1 CPBP family intramembrane metalloprotease [Salarchaeum sp. JOR-1]